MYDTITDIISAILIVLAVAILLVCGVSQLIIWWGV